MADLIDNVGVDIDDKFYAVESDSGLFGAPAADDPAVAIGSNQEFGKAIDGRLAALKVDAACGLKREHVLNRMAAMTCGGCHQFANAKEIAPGVTVDEVKATTGCNLSIPREVPPVKVRG